MKKLSGSPRSWKFLLVLLLTGVSITISCSKGSGQKDGGQPQPNLKKFVNSKEGLPKPLLEKFVDFSFDYPAAWKLIPNSAKGNENNFIKVERFIPGEKPEETYTLENFAVGWFSFTGPPERLQADFPKMVEQLSGQLARGFPNYKMTSQGPTTVGSYKGYEFRFTSRIDQTPKGPLTIWGRWVMVTPPDGSGKSVSLIMVGTNLAKELTSEKDLGTKGEIPIVLKSFKLGK